jgi:hypothetical protein
MPSSPREHPKPELRGAAEPASDAWLASRSPSLTRFAYLVTGNEHEAGEALHAAPRATTGWRRTFPSFADPKRQEDGVEPSSVA